MRTKNITPILLIGLFICGCVQVGFWVFENAPGAVGFTGAVATTLSAVLGYLTFRDAVALRGALVRTERMAFTAGDKAHTASVVAEAAGRTAADAKRGRRLSPSETAQIAAKLSGLDFRKFRVSIFYVAAATEAQDFAESIAAFLTSDLAIHCEVPVAINPLAGPQPAPRINGTLFGLRSRMCG